jgi:hypothetical protein
MKYSSCYFNAVYLPWCINGNSLTVILTRTFSVASNSPMVTTQHKLFDSGNSSCVNINLHLYFFNCNFFLLHYLRDSLTVTSKTKRPTIYRFFYSIRCHYLLLLITSSNSSTLIFYGNFWTIFYSNFLTVHD